MITRLNGNRVQALVCNFDGERTVASASLIQSLGGPVVRCDQPRCVWRSRPGELPAEAREHWRKHVQRLHA